MSNVGLGNFCVPIAEALFPVGTMESIELVDNPAGRFALAKIHVGFDEVVANVQAVRCRIELRFDQLQDLGQASGFAEVAAQLHEEVCRRGFGCAGQARAVQGQRRCQIH